MKKFLLLSVVSFLMCYFFFYTFTGKIWKPKEVPKPKTDDLQIELDLDDEYEQALDTAEEAELVDLAGLCFIFNLIIINFSILRN